MKNKLTKNLDRRIIDIVSLIYLSEINFEFCKQTQEFIIIDNNGIAPIEMSFLVLSSNNAFFSAVEILHTLLCSTKRYDIRLKPLLEEKIKNENRVSYTSKEKKTVDRLYNSLFQDYPNIDYSKYNFLDQSSEIGNQLDSLRKIKRKENILQLVEDAKKTFERNNFHKIRHLTIAHKNISLERTGEENFYLIRNKYVAELGKTIKKTMLIVNFGFDYSLENPKRRTLIGLKSCLMNYKKNKNANK